MAGPGTDALTRSVQPSPLAIRECSLWLSENCRRQGVPDGPTGKLELCLNEVLANLIDHGGSDACGAPVEVTLEVADGGERSRATLTISDAGEAFDPLSVNCRPRPRTLQEAEPGGLGLVLVRRLMDERSYERSGDRNVLRLGIHWSKGP